ncbi:hypothetical protein LIER_32467 [Lithospermum erythrorhizon]|uniref:Uncharacterized protein n=1 Tax=Lithospermum erythrorhizon TaxID=34254 RepID=A0AAV3RXK2_LITER
MREYERRARNSPLTIQPALTVARPVEYMAERLTHHKLGITIPRPTFGGLYKLGKEGACKRRSGKELNAGNSGKTEHCDLNHGKKVMVSRVWRASKLQESNDITPCVVDDTGANLDGNNLQGLDVEQTDKVDGQGIVSNLSSVGSRDQDGIANTDQDTASDMARSTCNEVQRLEPQQHIKGTAETTKHYHSEGVNVPADSTNQQGAILPHEFTQEDVHEQLEEGISDATVNTPSSWADKAEEEDQTRALEVQIATEQVPSSAASALVLAGHTLEDMGAEIQIVESEETKTQHCSRMEAKKQDEFREKVARLEQNEGYPFKKK